MVTPLREVGRFAEPALLILVLSDGPKHGYAIMADVEQGPGAQWPAGASIHGGSAAGIGS